MSTCLFTTFIMLVQYNIKINKNLSIRLNYYNCFSLNAALNSYCYDISLMTFFQIRTQTLIFLQLKHSYLTLSCIFKFPTIPVNLNCKKIYFFSSTKNCEAEK